MALRNWPGSACAFWALSMEIDKGFLSRSAELTTALAFSHLTKFQSHVSDLSAFGIEGHANRIEIRIFSSPAIRTFTAANPGSH